MRVRVSGSIVVLDRGVSCPLDLQYAVCSDEGGENGNGERVEIPWPLNDLVLCGELEEHFKGNFGTFC